MLYEHRMIATPEGDVPLTLYLPDIWQPESEHIKRTTILICGGGGFTHISPRETEPIALRFAAMGYQCATVAYRFAPNRWPHPVYDVAAAVAYLRRNAEELHVHPDRIAVMGFSAGGYAAGTVGTRWQDDALWAPVKLSPDDVRPNAMLLCYPVITAGAYAHRGSFCQLTGSDDPESHLHLSLDRYVTDKAPMTFLWHTWDDQTVPVENTLIMASALRKAGVSAEVHIYQHGSHGLALCDPTTALYADQIMPDCAGWAELAGRFLARLP